jgi:hypothetical protein
MILVALMAMAGCLGGTEPATPPEDPVVETYSLTPTWVVSPEQIQLGEEAAFVLNIMQEQLVRRAQGVDTILRTTDRDSMD